jgi:kynurenine 3-monooxygenase
MEDCIEIVRCLDDAGGNWTTALAEYQKRRKANADAIANYALQNFIEMRDTVNSKVFQAKNAVQHALERRSGGRYVSRYELVSFTTVPYSHIKRRLQQQNRVVAGAGAGLAVTAAVAVGLIAKMLRRHR